jgi:membrane protein DedA with SNARE-associated domain
MNVDALLAHYGVVAIFVGAMAEGETFVLAGGVLAHRGLISPVEAAMAAFLGSAAADQICFFLGRRGRGSRLVARARAKPAFAKALGFIERYPTAYILAFRYLYGLRVVSPVALGVSNVAALRFVVLNLVSAAVWAALFTTIGYVFGHAVDGLLARFHLQHPALIVLAVLGVAIAGLTWCHHHRAERCRT